MFSPATLQLERGERQTTQAILAVSRDAENGDYEVLSPHSWPRMLKASAPIHFSIERRS